MTKCKESGGGLFGGTNVTLRGLSLVERVSAEKAQARLDAIWSAPGGDRTPSRRRCALPPHQPAPVEAP
jgi:hypothetical protein